MARSKDAIERRAQKRNKSVAEQRQADAKEIRRQLEKEEEAARKRKIADNNDEVVPKKDAVSTATGEHPPQVSPTMPPKNAAVPQSENETVEHRRENKANTKVSATGGETFARDPLGEPGAWHCQGCGNHNFPSRSSCHSKTCDEKRPAGVFVPPRYKRPTSSRHDESTSKKLKWAKQADQSTLEQNGALRERFVETGGEGMEEEDLNRAKILIARDERKKNKKKRRGRAQ